MPVLSTTAKKTVCNICEKSFKPLDKIVRDHDHYTGANRGFAHNECNLNYQKNFSIPIVFHNLSGYDSHFIITHLAKELHVSLLPVNIEKYISFTTYNNETNIKFRFIDLFRFLSASLDELSSTLDKNKYTNLKKDYSYLDEDKLQLLMRKGLFCYDYIDSFKKLQTPALPSTSNFYNKLNDSNITDGDYGHAKNVWQQFNIKNVGENADLYLQTDILLLTDVFENFRATAHETYGSGPAWYYTLPGYTWDCMLKYTKCNLEIIQDVHMILFIESAIRGGVSMCSNRYAEANNKYLHNYNPNIPTIYLLYLDVNNLYGWAMSEFLPYGGFEWVENIENFDVKSITDDSPEGYFFEVDLKYPITYTINIRLAFLS